MNDDYTLPEKMAKEYPFTLDPFQARAVACLEANESVLVSAHTSAGKTVVAEYAIAMAMRDKQRVIYTSPIKALSNQKYRDLYEEFGDVGLMTGDVTINPNATALVMTTEILRSMLYRGSEVVREVKWVIFDEIHYMRDKERGVVWEETIILLPDAVRFVFLSATIPNAAEFAGWIRKIKHQPCQVVYTEYRPTPLQHFLFPAGGDGVYLIVDDKGKFRQDNFAKAMAVLAPSTAEADGAGDKSGQKRRRGKGGKGSKGGPPDLFRLVKMIFERRLNPVIVFSFSKREVERHATSVAALDLTTAEEKAVIGQVFHNAIDSLSSDDKALPQVTALLPLLKRGVGVHHGGLLPILKEIVEVLFGESLVKILFATETFAMGVNMPAKTVIFTSQEKFDGQTFRRISPGEYIQMSGRAGRRGLDDRGIVIQMIEDTVEPAEAKALTTGAAHTLDSSFHLGYNMLLNLLRVEGADPELLMSQSFHQYQKETQLPQLKEEEANLEAQVQAASAALPNEALVTAWYTAKAGVQAAGNKIASIISQPKFAAPFLQPGRLAQVRTTTEDWGWGVVVGHTVRQNTGDSSKHARGAQASRMSSLNAEDIVVDMLLPCEATSQTALSGAAQRHSTAQPCGLEGLADGTGELRVVPVLLSLLQQLSKVRLHVPADLRTERARAKFVGRFTEAIKRLTADGKSVPVLDPVVDLRVPAELVQPYMDDQAAAQAQLNASDFAKLPEAEQEALLTAYEDKLSVLEQLRYVRRVARGTEALAMKDTLKSMKRVLRRLGHVDDADVVQLKGRVACEVNTADELIITELIFSGALNDLTPAMTAAMLSCTIGAERSSDDIEEPDAPLTAPYRTLREAARRVGTVCIESGLPITLADYMDQFRPEMMLVVFKWANGAKFSEICKETKAFEGSIIRMIRRLEELLRQLGDAAMTIGDTQLSEKFQAASMAMKRDIVFAASLYL